MACHISRRAAQTLLEKSRYIVPSLGVPLLLGVEGSAEAPISRAEARGLPVDPLAASAEIVSVICPFGSCFVDLRRDIGKGKGDATRGPTLIGRSHSRF